MTTTDTDIITTDYTAAANVDTLGPGQFQMYRIVHWLRDIICNLFSSSINIRDERLAGLLRLQDGELPTQLDAMFRVDVPYNPKSIIKAGTTPAVIVSAGQSSYMNNTLTITGTVPTSLLKDAGAYTGCKLIKSTLQITTITESYDGTLLLSNLIEQFLATHELELRRDCPCLSQFTVLGASGPQEIPQDQLMNADSLYQSAIDISIAGSISWNTSTQGPLFRSLRYSLHM